MKTIFITGGAGFIGSALIWLLIAESDWTVVNIDKLTYAGNLESLASVADSPRYRFAHADICDRAAMDALFAEHQPAGIIHLAAESHVDRSIHGPGDFVQTNITGTIPTAFLSSPPTAPTTTAPASSRKSSSPS